jgi:hypothetical protein
VNGVRAVDKSVDDGKIESKNGNALFGVASLSAYSHHHSAHCLSFCEKFMSNIVISNGTPVTTSLKIASATGTQHKNVLEVIKRYSDEISEFGSITWKEARGCQLPQGGFGQKTRYAELNAAQASFVLSRSRRSDSSSILAKFISSIPDAYRQSVMDLIEDMDIEDMPSDRFVYVAQESESGRFKVGISKDPESRVKNLNVGNPEKLSLVAVFKATEFGYLSETKAHEALKDYRLKGEWFSKDAPIHKITQQAA